MQGEGAWHGVLACAWSDLPQYGNVFTFVLFGRNVTVALSPQGNNFVLGGKGHVFNAEDAYTVRLDHALS